MHLHLFGAKTCGPSLAHKLAVKSRAHRSTDRLVFSCMADSLNFRRDSLQVPPFRGRLGGWRIPLPRNRR